MFILKQIGLGEGRYYIQFKLWWWQQQKTNTCNTCWCSTRTSILWSKLLTLLLLYQQKSSCTNFTNRSIIAIILLQLRCIKEMVVVVVVQ